VIQATNAGSLSLDGASSSGNSLLVTTPGSDDAVYTPSSASSGALAVSSGGAPLSSINFSNIQSFTYDGQSDGDGFTILGTAGAENFLLTPGAANDGGALAMDSTLPVSIQNLGSGGQVVVNGNGGADLLVYNGTATNDTFNVDANASPAGGRISLNNRVPVVTTAVPYLTLEGLAGNDTFTLVPTIAASPYTTLNLHAGPPANPSGSQANLTAAAVADVSVSGQMISQSGKTVAGSNLANINLNGAGNNLIYNGLPGVTESINFLGSVTPNAGRLSVSAWCK